MPGRSLASNCLANIYLGNVDATNATKCDLDNDSSISYGGIVKTFLNASEVAKLAQVNRATITRWIRKGVLHAERIGHSRWRIPLSSYEQLVKKRK
jgi:excisionase family DNA binding protein